LNARLVQFGGARQFLATVNVWVVALCEGRLQVGQLVLRERGPMATTCSCRRLLLVLLLRLLRLLLLRLLRVGVAVLLQLVSLLRVRLQLVRLVSWVDGGKSDWARLLLLLACSCLAKREAQVRADGRLLHTARRILCLLH